MRLDISKDQRDELPIRPATDSPDRNRLAWTLRTAQEYARDGLRYLTHSATRVPRRLTSLRALVIMDTHRIEKGLAVPRPKPWFGRSIVGRLTRNVALYQQFGGDLDSVQSALATLNEYLDQNRAGASTEPAWVPELRADVAAVRAAAAGVVANALESSCGGTVTISREAVRHGGMRCPPGFFSTRHSIRDFAPEPVTWQELSAAVTTAQSTPSVCNRQSWRVHAFARGPAADAVLGCQNGNSGFGHTASHILLITGDLRTFVYLGERNQVWIDGGMFAMSLVYAFHAAGLGTCCLNWSVEHGADRRLREAIEIPEWEVVIMMLAVGRLPERLRVARSSRRRDAALRPGTVRDHAR